MKFGQKLLLVYTLLASLTTAAFAQSGKLQGILQNEKGEAIPFANVALLKATDSTLVTGAVTHAGGEFSLKTPEGRGKYFLQFSAVGYATTSSETFMIDSTAYSKSFGIVTVEDEAAILDEVTVRSARPTVIVEPDKMVVNVEGTAMAAGSTAYEVLSKAPGVWIDQDGNLQLNGKKGVEVMIDDRPTYLSAQELKTLLEGMPAENIKNIEIITNPSAKYDAEGTAGILNINLKKNTLSGMNGSLYGGYRYNGNHYYNSGGNLNIKKGNWSSFINVDVAQRGFVRDQLMGRVFVGEKGTASLNQDGKQISDRFVPSLRLGTDIELDAAHSIGVMANFSYQNSDELWNSIGHLNDYPGGQDSFIEARNNMDDKSGNGLLNLHHTWKIDTSGMLLSTNVDFVRLNSEGTSHFFNHYTFPESDMRQQEHLSSATISAYDIYSARIDFEWPVSKKTKVEIGAKASHVTSDSDLNFYAYSGTEKMIDADKSNHFVYKENIYAGYATWHYNIDDRWNVQGGVRAEQTVAEGRSITLNQTTPRSYLSLFPSLFVQQKVNDNYVVTYSYSRRILRPDYERLNPFIFYLDPYTYVEGNPQLRPQYTHAFQLTQTFWKSYNLILGFDHSNDVMVEVPLQDAATKETAFASRNMDNFRNYSATIVAPVDVTPDWSINNNVVLAHQQYSTVIENNYQENNQFFVMAQSNHQLQLPLDIKLELNAAYRGPLAYGLYNIDGQWWVDAGVKRSFMEDKLDLSVNFTDIFRSMEMTGGSEINGNITSVEQYFSNRSVRINLRYNFNRGDKFEHKDRDVKLEELDRAGGN